MAGLRDASGKKPGNDPDDTEDAVPALCLFPLTAPDGTPWAEVTPVLLQALLDGLDDM